MINYQTVKIFWNSGEMEIAASAIAFAPLANLRKLIFPHLAGCSPEDKKKIIDCIVADYSAAVEREKVSNAKALFARLSEFCTVCGVNLPANLPKIKTGNNPDYNYKINYKKLAIVGSIPAPGEDFERCTVPITRRNDTSGLTECYAGDGYGMLINGVPCYAQKVKSNLYIFNCCGASAASIQWKNAAEARDGMQAAFAECMKHPEAVERLPGLLETISEYMELPETRPEIVPEAPAEPAPEAPAPVPAQNERQKAKRRAAPDWVGRQMIAYPKKKKRPDFVGRKMIITIGERSARPA